MGERWINAVIEVIVPLDVALDGSDEAKRDAVAARLDQLELPADGVATGRWEVVEDGEPAGIIVATEKFSAGPNSRRRRLNGPR